MQESKFSSAAKEVIGEKPLTVPTAPVGRFSEAASEVLKQSEVALRSSFQVAGETEPERYAKALDIGKRLDLPASVVNQDFDKYKREDEFKQNDFSALEKSHPYLTQWLKNPDNAATTRDEIPYLQQLDRAFRKPELPTIMLSKEETEQLTQDARREAARTWSGQQDAERQAASSGAPFMAPQTTFGIPTFGSLTEAEAYFTEHKTRLRMKEKAFLRGDEMGFGERAAFALEMGGRVGRQTQQLGLRGYELMQGDRSPELAVQIQQLEKSLSETPEGGSFWDGMLYQTAQVVGQMVDTISRSGERVTEGAAYGAGIAAVAGVAGPQAALPEEVITVPTAAVTGASLGLTVAFAEDTYKVEAGHAYIELDKIRGLNGEQIDEETKQSAATFVGLANSTLELVGLKLLSGPAKAVAKRLFMEDVKKAILRPTFKKAILNFGKEYAKSVGGEVTTEALQESVNILAGEVAKAASEGQFQPTTIEETTERLAEIAAKTFQGTALLGLPGATGNLVMDGRKALRAEEHAEALKVLGETIQGMKLKERSPEKLRELVEHETKGTGSEFKYAPIDTFTAYVEKKGLDPVQLAMDLTGNPKAYEDALKTTQDLEIPTATWATKVVGTEHEAFLQDELRDTPKSMNRREAKAWKEGQKKAQEENEKNLRAHEESFAPIVRELRSRGIAPIEGIEGSEYVENIPLRFRKLKGVPIDEWISELSEKGMLPQGATQEDFYKLIRTATTKPAAVMPEMEIESEPIPDETASFTKRLKAAITRVKDAIVKGLGGVVKEVPALKDMKRADLKRYAEINTGHLKARAEATGRPIEELAAEEIPNFALGDVAPEGSQEQPAYHGSPHQFEKFSLQKIGSGEGAQVFGWGLYFAGKKKVAKFYRSKLSAIPKFRGAPAYVVDNAFDIWEHSGENLEKALSEAGEFSSPSTWKVKQVIKKIAAGKLKREGRLYEVDIPEDGDYLDWDKPLSEQSPKVKEALGKLGIKNIETLTEETFPSTHTTSKGVRIDKVEGGYTIQIPNLQHDDTVFDWKEVSSFLDADADPLGEAIYRNLSSTLAKEGLEGEGLEIARRDNARNDEAASKKLASLGIAGIKYLDQSSRKQGEGSSNYVVFDDKLIKILRYEQDPNATGGEGKPRGFYDPSPDLVAFMPSADRSTMFHEPAHRWLFQLGKDYAFLLAKDAASLTDVQKRFIARTEKLLAWLEVENFAQLDVTGMVKDSPEYIRAKAAHEKFARGFEVYLMEGKAPSKELRGVFWHFKRWLLAVYKEITKLGITLNPEVRDIYDHLLATEEEIAAAKEDLGQDRMNAQALGLEGQSIDDYNRAVEEDLQAAEEKLVEKALSDLRRREKAEWKAEEAVYRADIEKSVNDEPVYKAQANLRRGTLPNGSPLPEGVQALKLDRDSIPVARRPKLRGLYAVEGGVHPSMVAELYGFASANELLDALETAEPRKEKVESLVDETMRAIHGDPPTAEELKAEATTAVHNEKRVDLLMLRIKALAGRAQRRVTPIQVIREFARETVGRLQVRRIRPDQALRAERESARAAVEAAAKGDFEGAFNATERELLNHEIYRAAVQVREEIDGAIEKFARLSKPDEKLAKTRDVDLVNAARAILSEFGLGQKGKQPREYLEQLGEYDQDLFETIKNIVVQATEGATDYREATVERFMEMRDAVDALWDLSRRQRQMEIDGKIVDREEVVKDLEARLSEVKKPGPKEKYERAATFWSKVKMGLLSAKASLRRVESWVDAMDGGNPNGVFRRYIWTPIREAIDQYRQDKKEVIQKYLGIVHAVEKGLIREDIVATELIGEGGRAYVFSGKAELLGALLHTGNRSNLQKLLRGYRWGAFDEEGVVDTFLWDSFVRRMQAEGVLTKEDYDFVQAIWDLNEELKPQAQKAHKEMYGYYFDEVTADEFQTPWGTYRGGYAPAVADPNKVEDQAVRQERESLEKSDNSFMFPTAGRGFTKKRVEAYAAKLQLDLRFVPSHIDKVLRFIHIEPRVKDVGRLVWNREFQQALTAFDPTIRSEMLVPWLQRAAQQRVDKPSQGRAGRAMDTFFRGLRKRTGMQIMVANVANTLQQFTGISIAALKVKPKYLANGLWTYMKGWHLKGPSELAKYVTEKSLFMKNLTSTQVMEIQNTIDDLLLNPNTYEKARAFAERHGYFMQTGTQNVVNLITWSGAYDQAVEGGASEQDAVRQADSAVRETQGSFAAEDISRFEAGSPFVRLFTMFYSYFNMQANLLGTEFVTTWREMGLRKGAGRLLYIYTLGFMIPAVISEAITRAAAGGLDDEDDDGILDEMLALFFGAQFRSATAMIPGGSAFKTAVNSFTNENWHDDRISTSPAVSVVESAVKAPGEVYEAIAEGKSSRRAIQDTLTLIGLLSGFPVAPLGRPLGYVADVAQDKADPSGPIDFTRGLITGKPGTR